MATTQNTYTGNGSTTDYSITFEYLKDADVKVTLDHVATTAFTLPNATTLRFNTAPGNNVAIRIFRDTDVDAARFVYSAGSAIKAAELNENADQALYGLQETANTDDITDAAVTTAKLRDGAVTAAKLGSDAIITAKIADSAVTTAKIAADAVNGTKIADDSINSEHYVDGSIDTAHIADAQITTAKIADDAVTAAKLANDAVVTANIVNANVTTDKIADGAVTTAKIADAELVELSTMGGNTAAALADLTQSEVQILDGATVTTAELNILDGVTATATELNQLDGNTLKTTGTDFTSSSQFPAASEIDARITARIDPLGGFEAIADEDSFPATAPPAGSVVSIANANGLAVNSSGVGAGTRAGGSDAVVINGFPSTFNSTSLDNGIGLLVIATSTAHTYDFHRVVAKNEDVRQLSSDINDFKARYRIGSSNPTTDNDAGDLFFNTGTSKMLVYNASSSAWEEVQAIGDFFINTISSASGTGGGSATFNGSAYKFTLSNAPTTAQQLLVSINGVVQKPNSGTSQPSEGFALDGADIILAAAPATGSNAFFITIGSSVSIGTPSANTINNSMVKSDAAIAGTKISPSFGDQTLSVANFNTPSASTAGINLYNSGAVYIRRTDSSPIFRGYDGSTVKSQIGSDGSAYFTSNVGVGTSAPGASLHVSANDPAIYIQDANSTGNGINSTIQYRDSSNTQVAYFGYASGSDSHFSLFNKLSGGGLIFGTDSSERLRIDSSGNVLVGTTDSTIYNNGDNDSEGIVLRDGEVIDIARKGDLQLTLNRQTNDGHHIGFFRSGSAKSYIATRSDAFCIDVNGSERFRIDSSGNVAIGDTSAPDKLNVGSTSNGFTAIRILTSNTGNGELRFGDAGNGSAGYIRYAHNGNHLIFARDGTEAMRVSSGGRLLIGTTTTSVHGDRLIEIGSTSRSATYQAITTSTSGTGGIVFADTTTNDTGGYRGIIQYAHSNDSLQFSTSATERVRIDSSGNVGIGRTPFSNVSGYALQLRGSSNQTFLHLATATHGDTHDDGMVVGSDNNNAYIVQRENAPLIISTNNTERLRVLAAGGLTFNGDTAAANALDDYEEGTFTPTINTGFTASYNSQAGRYTKIGNLVYVFINIDLSALSGSDSYAYATINGLPFTASNTGNIDTGLSIAWQMNLGNSVEHAYVSQNETRIVLLGANSSGSRVHLSPSQVWDDADGRIAISGAYTTNA